MRRVVIRNRQTRPSLEMERSVCSWPGGPGLEARAQQLGRIALHPISSARRGSAQLHGLLVHVESLCLQYRSAREVCDRCR